jgi:hypothetical protein
MRNASVVEGLTPVRAVCRQLSGAFRRLDLLQFVLEHPYQLR